MCDQATVVGSISQLAINPEPFISSNPVGAAPSGSRVTVLCDTMTSDERLWVRVRYAGVEGWMSTRYLDDVGIVRLPDGRAYIVVLMSTALPSNAVGVSTLAEASRIMYEYEQQLPDSTPPQ